MVENVCIPLNLDAFILNVPVCDKGPCRIAPITQPDYVSLRLENSVIQHDILPPIDIHNSQPATVNPRISGAYSAPLTVLDLKNPNPPAEEAVGVIESRVGVYLHWSLPRGYRSGSSAAANTTEKQGDSHVDVSAPSPVFRKVPNRWLVVRILNNPLPASANMPKLDAWVVNSDQLRTIEELGQEVDLQTEVAPFVNYDGKPDAGDVLHRQAEKYIGCKTPLNEWSEQTKPSVELTIFNSSNPLFPDYTLHCPNVFSIKDNFEYDGNKHLTHAECDYVVVGWHSSAGDGPLGENGIKGDLNSRLNSFLCNLRKGTDQKIKDASDKTATLVHGAIYGVIFDRNTKPDMPAEKYAESFTAKVDMEPVSVGATPLDSVMTFLQAHRNDSATDKDSLLGPGASTTAANILALSELLATSEDTYDERVKASDLMYAHNFKRKPGGFVWHYSKGKKDDGPPPKPSEEEAQLLHRLNGLQELIDIMERMKTTKQWALFALFFEFCSDPNNDLHDRAAAYADKVKELYRRDPTQASAIRRLEDRIAAAKGEINRIVDKDHPLVEAKQIANEAFFTRTDPTLTIAGLDSGWPVKYLKSVPVRFHSDINAPSDSEVEHLLTKFQLPNSSGNIIPTIKQLLSEGLHGKDKDILGFKKWAGQPFCPIFVEWEAMFYNVEYNDTNWDIEMQSTPLSKNNAKHLRYVNPNPLFNISDAAKDPAKDTRAISGRFLVLPQPSFALSAVVNQVLSTAGQNLPKTPYISPSSTTVTGGGNNGKPKQVKRSWSDADVREELVENTGKLKFISGDLSGFSDFLLTLGTGTHVNPNVKIQGVEEMEPLAEAYSDKVGKLIGLEKEHFQKMGAETAKTPFAFLEDFTAATRQPFKGVQHGQLAITKLIIVDKFGQVICAPEPHQAMRASPETPKFIHPCLSDQLCPSLIPDPAKPDDPDHKVLNTVFRSTDAPPPAGIQHSSAAQSSSAAPPLAGGQTPAGGSTPVAAVMNPFIQITPAINQDARINAKFLRKDENKNWKVCTDWDNPIFGWIIVNYADSALQFFTGDGVFYTSLRFGGPNGTMEAPKWAPFAQPAPNKTNVVSEQLISLINQMSGPPDEPKTKSYLSAMWDMINKAIVSMPFPPSQYSAYANAIVGKPLALVNVGISMELAEAVMKAQFSLPVENLPGKLGPTEEAMMNSYSFRVKIGDYDRPYDGVACYWDTNDSSGETIFEKMYTYFPEHDLAHDQDVDTPERVKIQPSNFPALTPYHPEPVIPDPFNPKLDSGLTQYQLSKMKVKTLLIDPYTSIHFYSSILPIKSIQLPEWSLQLGLKKMTAFFTLGPILVTKDVPKIVDRGKIAEADTWIKQQAAEPAPDDFAYPIKLPIAGGKGLWNWLQPYPNDSNASPSKAQPTKDPPPPLYNSFEVGNEDGLLRDDPAPYTLLEGFLQLARPLTQEPAAPPH